MSFSLFLKCLILKITHATYFTHFSLQNVHTHYVVKIRGIAIHCDVNNLSHAEIAEVRV